MLSTAIVKLKQSIFDSIRSDKTAECFTKALLTTFPASVNNDPDCNKIAENFGKVAARYLAGALTTRICDAVDDYVKEIGIQITPTKLISPHGPVSGTITPDEVSIL